MSTKTNTREIHQGEDKVLALTVREKESGDALDLTGLTAAEATFKGTSADVTKTLGSGISVTDAPKGKLQVVLDETDSAALKVGNNQDFKLKLVFGSDTKIKKIKNVLNIIDPSC